MSHVILDRDELCDFRDYILKQDGFVFDVETAGENRGVPKLNNVTWISLCTNGKVGVIPMGHPIGSNVTGYHTDEIPWGKGTRKLQVPDYDEPPKQLDQATVFGELAPVFAAEYLRKIAHGVIFDLASVTKYLPEMPVPKYGCTITEQWLVDENLQGQMKLKTQTKRMYGFEYSDPNAGKEIETTPFDKAAYYSYCDALYPWFMHADFMQRIHDEGLDSVYDDIEMPIAAVCARMKLCGAFIDVPRLERLRDDLAQRVQDAEKRIYVAAGHEFNVNSNPQKQQVLFSEQGLKPWKLTKGAKQKKRVNSSYKPELKDYAVDDEVLEGFEGNPVVDAIRTYGDVDRLYGTYVKPWLADNIGGFIYADFVPYGTVTGRFSCRAPNLQNLHRPSTALGKSARSIFWAGEGRKLVAADFSQIEYVVLAHLLGHGALYDGFWAGIDPHRIHAAGVLNKAPEDVTDLERQVLGKSLGFAIGFGAQKWKVASMAKVSVDEAERILAKYDEVFPEVHQYKEQVLAEARKHNPPYTRTLLGRKRRIKELNSSNKAVRARAERQIFNTVMQGGAADLIKLAMIRIDGYLLDNDLWDDVQLIMTIHDELILNSPADKAGIVAHLLHEAMTGEGIQSLVRVPLKAEVKIAERWSDTK